MEPEALQRRLQAGLAGRYAVDRAVGYGGSASVYLARDLRHRREVALKVLYPELSAAIGAQRFLAEIETVAQLQHPHILPLYDSGEADGLLYFVMPFASDGTLRHRLEREGRLPLAEAVSIIHDLASALAFAHARGIVHRDIKPENVLMFSGTCVLGDFGIARALSATGAAGRLTDSNLVPGTPPYMSPEQVSGSRELDGRSDQYSLACMLHELVAGQPPFGGTTPVEVMAQHLAEPPRLAADLPPSLLAALRRALAKDPTERFPSVEEFADAIRQPSDDVGALEQRRRGARRRRLAVAGGVGVAGVAALVLLQAGTLAEPLAPNRYLVLPFQSIGADADSAASGERLAMVLRQSLGRWSDLTVVTGVQTNDAWQRRDEDGLRGALRAARRSGASYLVWGQRARVGDSFQVDAALYDVRRSGRVVRERRVVFGPGAPELTAAVDSLAALLIAEPSGRFIPGPQWTSSLAAWEQYAAGHGALARWSLAEALAHFRGAVALDPDFALAHLWIAQLLLFDATPPQQWHADILAAARNAGRLGAWKDSAHVRALLSLAENAFPAACAGYRAILRRDSLDVIAWFGLAECHRRDRVVIRDAASPSGWRFRSSHHAASSAYARALELAPAVSFLFGDEVFDRLRRALAIERGYLRFGRPPPPDTTTFAAAPALDHDTVAFTPWPMAAVLRVARPPTLEAAVASSRERLRGIAERWASAFPASARARATLALTLELDDRIGRASEPGTALGEMRRARQLATDSAARTRYGAATVRLLLKSGDFAAARSLADSLLVGWEAAPREAARALAGLAGLVGRQEAAGELFARAAGDSGYPFAPVDERLPLQPVQAALRFATMAALGAPADSLSAQLREVERLVQTYVAPARRRAVWHTLMDVPLVLAYPAVKTPSAYPYGFSNRYLDVIRAIESGDSAAARSILDEQEERHRGGRPGELAVSSTYLNCRLVLALGDTAVATRRLLATLEDLALAPTLLIDEPVQSGGLVQAMLLAARLGQGQGDQEAARRWAGRAVALWSGADAPLRAQLEHLPRP